jgi:hypothetical protein
MERRGWIQAHWATSSRRAQYDELTQAGRRLAGEADVWNQLATAVAQVPGTA